MKRLLILILLLMTLVGCIPAYIIFFGDEEFEVRPICQIAVVSYTGQPTFFLEPLNYPALVTSSVMESEVSEENGDFVILSALFGITRYTIRNGEYWFEVDLNGMRRTEPVFLEDEVLTALDNEETIGDYIIFDGEMFEQDRIIGGRYWIPESVVFRRPSRLSEGLCYWHILNGTFEELGIPEQSDCVVYPVAYGNDVRFRVGAGTNRGVRFERSYDFTFPVLGYDDVSGVRWYQVEAEGYAEPVWVHEDDVIVDGNCDDILPTQSPPLSPPQTNNSNDFGNCEDFTLLGLSGVIPDGIHTFRWTLVNGADEYVVHFYDYQGNHASVHYVNLPELTVHTGTLDTGSQLSLEVYAMQNGDMLCGTGRSSTQERLAAVVNHSEEPPPEIEKNDKKKNHGGYTPPDEEDYIPPSE